MIAGVSALIVLDIILVAWVVGRPQASEAEQGALGPSAVAVESPEPSTSPSASPTPSAPTGVAAVDTVPATRILTAVDGQIAWRAVTGSCPDAVASPEITTDAGATWRPTDATGPTGVTALQRIITGGSEVATMVGAAADTCAPTIIRTYVAGDNYEEYPAEIATAWRIDPADRARVGTPSGAVDAPCATGAIAIAPSSDSAAAVLCADGTVATTADAGAAWSTPVEVAGAQALAPTSGGYVVARLGGSACAGVGLVVLSSEGAVVGESGCVSVTGALESFAGQVAVSDGGGTWWVWVGESLVRSADRGATWS